MAPGRSSIMDLVLSESDSEREERPVRKQNSLRKKKPIRRSAVRRSTDMDSEDELAEGNTIIVMPTASQEVLSSKRKRQQAKGAVVVSRSESQDENDCVPGMPKGRLWMAEVRVPSTPPLAMKKPLGPSKPLLQTSLLNHFAKKNVSTQPSKLPSTAKTSTATEAQGSKSARASFLADQSSVRIGSTSGPSSLASTPVTSPGSSILAPMMPQSTRPQRKAVAQGAYKRAAIAIDDDSNEDSVSDFQATPVESEESSEPSSMVIDSDEASSAVSDEDFDEPPLSKTLRKPQVGVQRVQRAEQSPDTEATAPATKRRKDNSNAKERPAQDLYASALDRTLPPISNIADIFVDITSNALNVSGVVKLSRTTAGRKIEDTVKIKYTLNDVLKHLGDHKLRVATMCSGTESPILALGLVDDALRPQGKALHIDHLFSAEIVPSKQAYIERNFNVPTIFRDITEMSMEDVTEATTAYGAKVLIPGNVDLLVTGFSCVDHSNLNVNRKTTQAAANKKGVKTPSESGDTMMAMLAYIEKYRPKVVVIENVAGAPWALLGPYLEQRRYASRHMRVDTKDYYIPHTRVRGYMFCVDRDLYKANPKDADLAVVHWEGLMKQLQRQASSPVEDFLLSQNDPRLIQGREELASTQAEKTQRKAIDWKRCRGRHDEERLDLGLGYKKPLTNWVDNGSCKGPDYMWGDWITAQVERVWDTMDINLLRTFLSKGFDNQYKARIIDLSQNVDRNTDSAKSGVTSCLTPSGIPYNTLRGGPVLGLESLALQGIPIDKLQLTQESQAKLQDLAGNAMSSTVVGPAILSALISAHKILPRGTGDAMDESEPFKVPLVDPSINVKRVVLRLNDYEALSVDEACEAAARSARLCYCENNFGVARAQIMVCKHCKHTACGSCGTNPLHSYVPHEMDERISPVTFQAMISAALPMKIYLDGVSPAQCQKFETAIDNVSKLNKAQKQTTKEAFHLALRSELRFCLDVDRSEIWTFGYNSNNAHLKLIISAHQIEWQLFAKAPTKEPANSPVRDLLANPILRMLAVGSDLTKGSWEMRLPVSFKITAVITGQGDLIPSFGNKLGLKPYEDTFVYSEYMLAVDKADEAKLEGAIIGGTYKALPKCGTATDSLHILSDTADSPTPTFLFLDPDRLGKPSDDSFVISKDRRRLVKDKRMLLAQIDSTWRPDIVKKEILADNSVKLSSHEIWERGTGAMQTHHAKTFKYEHKPSSVVLRVDGKYNKLPGVRIDPGRDIGVVMRADSTFQLRSSPGSCQAAHVILRCEGHVLEGELTPWQNRSFIDKIDEAPFFADFAWLTKKAQIFSELSQWQTIQQCSSDHCDNCCPKLPLILWRRVKDGKVIPFEHHREAANFERATRNRVSPIVPQISVTEDGTVALQLAVNPETLMHRAAQNLRTSASDKIDLTWRLWTENDASAMFSFPKLTLMSNEGGDQAAQPPSFKKHELIPNQLRSLKWMIDQERNPEVFVEQEVEERVVDQLGWRLDGRAAKELTVRGGVLADEVGFGKTVTTLALIDTHREQDFLLAKESVTGRISLRATLILVPHHLTGQWESEAKKFLCGSHKYGILVIDSLATLGKTTIANFQAADIIIVSWKICENDSYLFKVAQFTGRNELPSKYSNRAGIAWYKRALKEIDPHVEELKKGGKTLDKTVMDKLREDQRDAAAANAESYVPSKRLTGAKYREAKLQKAEKKHKLSEDDDSSEDFNNVEDKEPRREEAQKRADDFKLKSIAAGQRKWTQMPCPILELFKYTRVVVDEYTYASGIEDMVIQNLQATYHWILSGTPPLQDFTDVKTISKFLGIKLGIDDLTPGVTKSGNSKRLAKDLTSSEKFQSYKVARSSAWHKTRHQVAQGFLDQFVRQNHVDFDRLPASRHYMPVSLPAAERAVYIELQGAIAALGGMLPSDSEKQFNDRDLRIQDSGQSNTLPGEALIKAASHFTLADSATTQSGEVNVLVQMTKVRKSQYSSICTTLEDMFRQAEGVQRNLLHECSQYTFWKSRVESMGHFGDSEAGTDIQNILQRVTEEPNRANLQKDHNSTDKKLRDLTNKMDKVAHSMVRAIRGLRFLQSVQVFHSNAQHAITCLVCKKIGLSIDDASILVKCGHIVCRSCLNINSNDLPQGTCRVPHCGAINEDYQIIPATEFTQFDARVNLSRYFGKKLDDLVKLIEHIPDDEQVLMFVQHVEVIQQVSHTLNQHKIKHTILSQTDAASSILEGFQTDTSPSRSKVLVMNIGNASAAGSNLTNANHVIFLSPYYIDSSDEYIQAMVQAEARARRFGQEKHVHMYNFVSLKTIDVDIVESRSGMVLTAGLPQEEGYQLPYRGFQPSHFGLRTGNRTHQVHGQFRSESSTCIGEDGY